LPEVKPYQGFVYQSQNLRSPFVPPVPEETIDTFTADNGIHPDVERRKELLENYPLDTLRMVGTMDRHAKKWAIIVDKDGAVHRVSIGNYIGNNHGKIELITDEKIYNQPVTKIKKDGIKDITIEMKKVLLMNLGFTKFGWLGTYIILSIIISMILRKLMRVY